jgi:hypothetical protein
MKVSLEALGLWEAVEVKKANHREDRLALATILRAGGYEGEPRHEEDDEGGMGCSEGDADG